MATRTRERRSRDMLAVVGAANELSHATADHPQALVRIFADLRQQFLGAADQFPGFHVFVFKSGSGLIPPPRLLSSSDGILAPRKNFDGHVSCGLGESQYAACDNNPAARQRYEMLATAAGTNLPLDRFPAHPVLPTKSHHHSQGAISIWTGFVFNQLRRDNSRQVKTFLAFDEHFCHRIQESLSELGDESGTGDEPGPQLPSHYAIVEPNIFTASALAISASGLLIPLVPTRPGLDGPVTPDCRSFRVQGVVETFTPSQAAVIKVFWDALQHGANELAIDAALETASVNSRTLRDVFKIRAGKMHPAYERLFRDGSKKGLKVLNVRG